MHTETPLAVYLLYVVLAIALPILAMLQHRQDGPK